jgi:hypothetical protein
MIEMKAGCHHQRDPYIDPRKGHQSPSSKQHGVTKVIDISRERKQASSEQFSFLARARIPPFAL